MTVVVVAGAQADSLDVAPGVGTLAGLPGRTPRLRDDVVTLRIVD